MKRSHGYRQTSVLLASGFLTAGTLLSSAQAGMNLTSNPLFLADTVEPNIMFSLDDSGSMQWETIPDELTQRFGDGLNNDYVMWTFPRQDGVHGAGDYNNERTVRFRGDMAALYRSPSNNPQYYDPSVTYRPWIEPDTGVDKTAHPAEEAPHHPTDSSFGTRNLVDDNTETTDWLNDDGTHTNESVTFYPALYYHYNGSGDRTEEASYERVTIHSGQSTYSGHGREHRSDCSGDTCTYEQEIQNFSNWYTYHRNRAFAAKAGIARAFFDLDETVRVGFGTINSPVGPLETFDADNRTAFIEALYEEPIDTQGTPLRQAAWDVGKHFEDNDEPYDDGNGELLECRRNYHVLMTDGYWNDTSFNSFSDNITTEDGDVITNNAGDRSGQYLAIPPFAADYGSTSGATLADIALHFWKRDLREDMDNRVPGEAFWQHVSLYGVALGVQGQVDPDVARAAARAAYGPYDEDDEFDDSWPDEWPDPLDEGVNSSIPAKIDDLLHASLISRGDFFSAQEAETFAEELSRILQAVAAEAGRSAGGVSANSTALQDGTLLFQASFDSANWTGDLAAFDATEDGSEPVWRASENIPFYENRNILTWDGSDGIWVSGRGTLSDAMATLMFDGDRDRWDWVRGNLELDDDPDFRDRDGNPLGDIVNSEPVLAGTADFQFERLPSDEGGSAYREFHDDKDRDVVYVGANDGMLHAFDAETGEELFAFIPEAVFEDLNVLPDPSYLDNHQFFVDGSVTVSDAYVDGEWRTILVGSTGLGARSIFALDVTNPTNPEALWEFTDPDLGYTVGKPTIARLENGDWVAAFGNGYNSDEHGAVFFTIDLGNGEVQDRIPLANGAADDPNGLAAVVPVDLTGDRITDRFYAGDLDGNMHRIDASDADSLSSSVLFQATDPENDQPQPITSRPAVSGHPDPGVVMVFFGTGQFLENGDNVIADDEQIQTFYGVRDDGDVTDVDRGDLLPQEIEEQSEQDGFRIRRSSQNSFSEDDPEGGWLIDLLFDGVRGTPQRGERVLFAPQLAAGRVSFTTFTPNDEDPCAGGGFNWLMELNAIDGSQSDRPIFDLSGDGEMDFDGSGVAFGEGPPTPEGQTLEVDDETGELIYDVEEERLGRDRSYDAGVLGRQSWREFD